MKLKKALETQFATDLYGDGTSWEPHHIIPQNGLASDYYDYLREIRFDIDGSQNGVPLPRDADVAAGNNVARHTNQLRDYTLNIREQLDNIRMLGLTPEEARAKVVALTDNIRSGLACPSSGFLGAIAA